MQLLHAFLDAGNPRAKVDALQPPRDHHIPQQVLAMDFRLSGKLGQRGQRSERRRFARRTHQQRVAHGLEQSSIPCRKAHAHGVGAIMGRQ